MMEFQKKKQLEILVKIAMVDEEFADSEKDVIKKISERYGASEQEMAEIFNSPHPNESLAPMTVVEKMDFMMDCMLVILADDVVTKSEESFAMTMASNLGFKYEVIAFLIQCKDKSREEMKELMLPYLVH